jgi:hypothetical protein
VNKCKRFIIESNTGVFAFSNPNPGWLVVNYRLCGKSVFIWMNVFFLFLIFPFPFTFFMVYCGNRTICKHIFFRCFRYKHKSLILIMANTIFSLLFWFLFWLNLPCIQKHVRVFQNRSLKWTKLKTNCFNCDLINNKSIHTIYICELQRFMMSFYHFYSVKPV